MAAKEVKQLKDYTQEVAEKVPEFLAPLKSNSSSLPDVLGNLLGLEKRTRLAADAKSTVTVVLAILNACWEQKDLKALNDHITILCKRRAQLQKVIEELIKEGVKFVNQIKEEKDQRELIETLRAVSAGKMFVELERARLTKLLAEMEERNGKIKEAAEVLQEVQVETIGSMEVHEKANFLLEQIRLVLAKKDYVRVEIIGKKVDLKQLKATGFEAEKIKYYKLMIQYHSHYSNYLEICKAWREIYNTTTVQADAKLRHEALSKLVIYAILSPFDSDVSDILHRLVTMEEKSLAQLPAFHAVLKEYTGDEIMSWPLTQEAAWKQDSVFQDSEEEKSKMDTDSSAPAEIITEAERKEGTSSGKQRWADLHKRIAQHNIRVVGSYYSRITSQRLAELLKLDADRTEMLLSEMVSAGQLYAKIDRPAGRINFQRPLQAAETLNQWANDLNSLLNVVEKTCHMINKENMIHKIK